MSFMQTSGVTGVAWPWSKSPQWVENNQVIDQAIRDVIFTRRGERKMNPDFGSDAISTVFENKGFMLEALAKRTISLALAQHLPTVQLLNIDVSEGETDNDPVTITVDYVYLGSQGTVATEVEQS